jgi:hypothetical protein
VRVTPDGRYLVFMSDRSLTGYDNRSAVTGRREQEIYVYGPADSGQATLRCVSCDPTGARPDGGSWIPGGTQFEDGQAIYQSRLLTDPGEGARVFFDSNASLVPQDVNGREDVYEWEEDGVGSCGQAAGCLSLISDSTSGSEASFLDASEDGRDVFFLTTAQLVPQDTDQLPDIYDAREGGTPAVVPSLPPVCSGEGCKGPVEQTPLLAAPVSASFVGAGNPASATVKHKPVRRKHHKRPRKRRRGRARGSARARRRTKGGR